MQETHIFRLNDQENCVGALNHFHLDGNVKRHWLAVDMGRNLVHVKRGSWCFGPWILADFPHCHKGISQYNTDVTSLISLNLNFVIDQCFHGKGFDR